MDVAGSVLLIELVHFAVFAWLKRRGLCRLLAAEQQLRVYERQVRRPTLTDRDPLFWVLFSKLCKGWREHLTVVQPRAVLQWHKRRAVD